MMFSQLSEELEEMEEAGIDEKNVISKVDFEAALDAEVSNWSYFPTSLSASTQTRGIFVPRVARCQTEKTLKTAFTHIKSA